MDVGFAHRDGLGCLDEAKVVYDLGADEVDMPEDAFVIYQGSHGDRGAHRADVILPGAAYTEQSGTYVNLEGRVQFANRAGFPPGEAKEDWAILRALSAELGQTLPYDSLSQVRAALFEAHPHLAEIDVVGDKPAPVLSAGDMSDAPFQNSETDHYLVNPICRASEVLAECARFAAERKAEPMAAE